ncbi:MAG: DNA methylase [Bilifractor sp.]
MTRTYIAIDLKSYYASAECADRGLDPLTTNLVVADTSRTDKTICLAVSPSLKAYGIPGRARLFEVKQKVRQINAERLRKAISLGVAKKNSVAKKTTDGSYSFTAESFDARALAADPSLKLSFIAAPPRMTYYMKTSASIFEIYSKYISADDILVYSIDEVFFDATSYLSLYNLSAYDLAKSMIREVLYTTGITATAGIGTNLYLAKIAMDIVAKHIPADKDGVRIASLTEESFRYLLWNHKPITDFWRIAKGTAKRLEKVGIHTMGDLARMSTKDQTWLYKEFGMDAEILIDHAWGREPVGMKEIKTYQPSTTNFSEGQVLSCPTDNKTARLILSEMADNIVYRLTDTGMVTNGLVLYVGYDRENVDNGVYHGPLHTDHYGRSVPPGANGTVKLKEFTLLGSEIIPQVLKLFDQITDPKLTIRRLNLAAIRVRKDEGFYQLDLFTDVKKQEKEKNLQEAMLAVRKRYGKNMLLKGKDLIEGATARERNGQVGGHRA